jgi:hypothetical protein
MKKKKRRAVRGVGSKLGVFVKAPSGSGPPGAEVLDVRLAWSL